MRSAGRHGTRRWLPLAAVPVLVVSGVAASGCSSSPPAYCTAAFPSQTTALKNSLTNLETTIKSVHGQPPLTAATAVVSSVTQVKNSASALQSAVSGKCS